MLSGSRKVLEWRPTIDESMHAALRLLVLTTLWSLKLAAVCFFIYCVKLLQDMPRISAERLVVARDIVKKLDRKLNQSLPRWRETQESLQELMHVLGKPLPRSTLGDALFLGTSVCSPGCTHIDTRNRRYAGYTHLYAPSSNRPTCREALYATLETAGSNRIRGNGLLSWLAFTIRLISPHACVHACMYVGFQRCIGDACHTFVASTAYFFGANGRNGSSIIDVSYLFA